MFQIMRLIDDHEIEAGQAAAHGFGEVVLERVLGP